MLPASAVPVSAWLAVSFAALTTPLITAASAAGAGFAGAVVSSVTPSAEVVELLPAASVNWAVIDFEPSAPRSPAVTVRLTPPAVTSAAVIVCVTGCASAEPPRRSWTVSPATTVELSATVKVGAVTLVMPSVCEVPEFDAGARIGAPPLGAVSSTATAWLAVVAALPAASDTFALML